MKNFQVNYWCCFLLACTLVLIKTQTFKHTFIYRTTFKLHGDNLKDNYVVSQWVSSVTTLNWLDEGCYHQKSSSILFPTMVSCTHPCASCALRNLFFPPSSGCFLARSVPLRGYVAAWQQGCLKSKALCQPLSQMVALGLGERLWSRAQVIWSHINNTPTTS